MTMPSALHSNCVHAPISRAVGSSAPKLGWTPNLCMAAMTTQMLCASTLQSASFIWPVSLLLSTESPNLALIMENVVSTLERLW